ncbi:hypothetical protein O4J56_07050 [Nocardiopsis sp. RSe5-2]|uniref:Uncharacterized protein n=1 Tax=Nocardiopsis endophytica TaxID=3018445 RepID=A0ABT4U0C4_9ACTN|nr:hypothetical protein [Nocardiopsis endophytica]MDA2810393.1 hypothetical protein [Nocardiopsis endophytica]
MRSRQTRVLALAARAGTTAAATVTALAVAVTIAPPATAEPGAERTFGEPWADLVVVAPDRLPGGAKGFMVGHPDIEEIVVAEVRDVSAGRERVRVLAADPDELAGFQRVFGEERAQGAWGDLGEGALVPAPGSEEAFPGENARVGRFGTFDVAEPARPPFPDLDAVVPAEAADESDAGRTNAALVSARWADLETLRAEILDHLPPGSTVEQVAAES